MDPRLREISLPTKGSKELWSLNLGLAFLPTKYLSAEEGSARENGHLPRCQSAHGLCLPLSRDPQLERPHQQVVTGRRSETLERGLPGASPPDLLLHPIKLQLDDGNELQHHDQVSVRN